MPYSSNAATIAGPNGSAAWVGFGGSMPLTANATLGTAAQIERGFLVGDPDTSFSGGIEPAYTLASGDSIARLTGGRVYLTGTLIAEATLALGLAVYRAGSIVGGSLAYGWLYASGAIPYGSGAGTPAFATAYSSLKMPAITTNTVVAQYGFVPLQPGDLILPITVTQTSTVNLPAGGISASVS